MYAFSLVSSINKTMKTLIFINLVCFYYVILHLEITDLDLMDYFTLQDQQQPTVVGIFVGLNCQEATLIFLTPRFSLKACPKDICFGCLLGYEEGAGIPAFSACV